MKIYDVTVTLSSDIPIWPGDPAFVRERIQKLEKGDNTNTSKIEMSVHTATHVDAPCHFLAGGKGVDQLSLKLLTGRVYVLYLPQIKFISADVLKKAEIPPRTRRLLIKTDNSQYWEKQVKEFQTDFVAITADGADYLVQRGVKLIGVDYLSVAPYKDSRPTHEILLKAGTVIIEGLNLQNVDQGRYMLYCLPLKIEGSDGAPARTILVGV
ncbi:MAG: cyclase family protein [Anaerolineales bacterium]